jgi:hypothetical protein
MKKLRSVQRAEVHVYQPNPKYRKNFAKNIAGVLMDMIDEFPQSDIKVTLLVQSTDDE